MFGKTNHQSNVEQFMVLAQQKVPDKPFVPDVETRWLRAKLILEEAIETVRALGFASPRGRTAPDRSFEVEGQELCFADVDPSLVEIVDGCCDIKVVTTGTLSACGVPDDEFQEEVDKNNLAKFGPGGYRREDGKWVKPPDHKPPDIAGLLDKLECSK